MNKTEHRKIEIAKTLKDIRDSGFVNEENFEVIKKMFLTSLDSEAAIVNAIKGLSEEDEFALMCRLMGTTTHLVPLQQRPILSGDYIVPDFLAKFQPGCSAYGFSSKDSSGFKCFIEVKSSPTNKRKIDKTRLRLLRNFADQFGLPLLFAVRFLRFGQNAVWVIVEDTDRKATSLIITLEHLVTGIRHILWDETWCMLLPGIYLKYVFDLNYRESGAGHTEYGTLVELQIIVDDQITSFVDGEASVYAAFFEAFHLKEVEVQRQGSITFQVRVPQLLVCSMVDAIYKLNQLPFNEKGDTAYDASKIIAQLDETPFDIDLINQVAQSLVSQGFLGFVGITDKDTCLKKWREYGGQK